MTSANVTTDAESGDTTLSWIGPDERSRELEVVALDRPDCFLVIHVMPTHYRKAKKRSTSPTAGVSRTASPGRSPNAPLPGTGGDPRSPVVANEPPA